MLRAEDVQCDGGELHAGAAVRGDTAAGAAVPGGVPTGLPG